MQKKIRVHALGFIIQDGFFFLKNVTFHPQTTSNPQPLLHRFSEINIIFALFTRVDLNESSGLIVLVKLNCSEQCNL
jgi:hypothetical protein